MNATATMNPIKHAMDRKSMSVRDLAALVDMDVTQIYRLLNGKARTIQPQVLAAFARMGINPDRLSKHYKTWRNKLAMDVLARVADVDGDPVKAEAILAELTASNKTAEV